MHLLPSPRSLVCGLSSTSSKSGDGCKRGEKEQKNTKKRGKVKIIAGIMTREQESDSTISPEKEEGGVKTPSPQRLEGRQGYQRPLHGGYVPQPVVTSREVMCSFCGGNTHDYRDCPVMQQYIREQADALAQRSWVNTNTYRIGRGMKSQDNYPLLKTLSQGEGESDNRRSAPSQGPSLNKEFKNRKGQPGWE